MGHRAGLYTVRVRKKYARRDEQPRLLGDFDEEGTSLAEALGEVLEQDFHAASTDGGRQVGCLESRIDGDDVFAVLQHGESGVSADIAAPEGDFLFHQRPEHTHNIRCAILFQLPRAQHQGVLAVHINNGRGVKSLLLQGIVAGMRERYPGVSLDVEPFISVPVLDAAVDGDMIEKVTLVRYEKPQDRAIAATDKWVRAGQVGKIELDIQALGRGERLKNTLLKRFRQDPSVRDQIVAFEGLTFDEAKVEVVLPGRGRKTFNIENPQSGHPITVELEVVPDAEGEPTSDSLLAALRDAAADVD